MRGLTIRTQDCGVRYQAAVSPELLEIICQVKQAEAQRQVRLKTSTQDTQEPSDGAPTQTSHTLLQLRPSVSARLRSTAQDAPPSDPNLSQPSTTNQSRTSVRNSNPDHLRFVLLCVPIGLQTRSAQIAVHDEFKLDRNFFASMRAEYRRLRGLLPYRLSPVQFHYCHFVRMKRWAPGRLDHIRNETPPLDKEHIDYELEPRAPKNSYEMLIVKEEWYEKFHNASCACFIADAVQALPKRSKRFELETHVNGRLYMFGIYVHYRFFFVGVLCWFLGVLSIALSLLAWWLVHHEGDLQSTSVPGTFLLATVACLTANFTSGNFSYLY